MFEMKDDLQCGLRWSYLLFYGVRGGFFSVIKVLIIYSSGFMMIPNVLLSYSYYTIFDPAYNDISYASLSARYDFIRNAKLQCVQQSLIRS